MSSYAPVIPQPSQVAIGSSAPPALWGAWTTNNAALPAATTKIHNLTQWEAVLATDGLYWFPSAGRVCGELALIAAKSTDNNNETFTARAWITEHEQVAPNAWEVSAYPAFDLAVTIGNTVVTAGSGIIQATPANYTKWADTLTATNDGTLSPGVRHLGGGIADIGDRIVWDFAGGSGLLLALTRNTQDAVRPRFRCF